MDCFDLVNPLTSFKEHQPDTVPSLFVNETVHMPNTDHFPASFRREAISLISKVQFSNELDPFIPYLAVNYMDRFISKREISQQGKPWIVGLVVISCISLAAKMKNADFSLSNVQVEEGLIYDAQSINRMEIMILTTLKWRMRSITPFSFIYYFLSLFELDDDLCLNQAIIDRASETLFKSAYEIKLSEFTPSIIAASAVLHASQHLLPLQYFRFKAAVSSCEYVNKGNLEECLGVMQDMATEWYDPRADVVSSCTNTPISVLDRHCTTSESENTTSHDSIKRRKLNGFCDNQNMLHLSQIQRC